MGTTITPSTPTGSSRQRRSARSVPPDSVRLLIVALGVFVGVSGMGLGIALLTGAVVVFNILIFTLFTVLWIAFASAIAFSPGTLSDLWHQTRSRSLVIQGVVWLLFLPIMIGFWIWMRPWPVPTRLVLIIALGAWNIFLFFPRSL